MGRPSVPRIVILLAALIPVAAEYALVILIRHGERYQDKRDIHLAPAGYERAAYIAKCVGDRTIRTMAFPLGPPDRLVASVRPPNAKGLDESVRPLETLEPLSKYVSLPPASTPCFTANRMWSSPPPE